MTETQNAPEPATFDLAAFIADKATYARYKCTVHLAAQEANRSVELAEEIDKLRREREHLTKLGPNQSSQASLGETSPTTRRASEIDEQLSELVEERNPLVDKVKASALTFYFAVTGRDVQARISERINALITENEDAEPVGDADQIQARVSRKLARDPMAVMRQTAVMMRELTVEVRNARNEIYPIDKLTEEGLVDLLNTIPLGEITRINDSMGLAMSGAQDFDRAVDAGFPR